MGTFQHFTDANGQLRFRLRAADKDIILISEPHTTKASLRQGILAVRNEAVHDARFVREEGPDGWSFKLRTANGQLLGTSKLYGSALAREDGIQRVKRHAPNANEVD
jgi:uncharacterized protein YegP (UPF0339 family)